MDGDKPNRIDPPDTGLSLDLDTVLELLANQRRRFVLYTLADTPDQIVTFEVLFEDVATLETALAGDALTRDRYLNVVSDLYHWHLPVLADVGIIDCDDRSRTIRYWNPPLLDTWTARVRSDELSE